MFELLLQADRALSGGNLDQAERTYWQLSELDPTNAIAIAGLARVALERGDDRLARLFATRALVLDPESVAATRIIETIDHVGEDSTLESVAEPLPEDLPLIAAQRLEALGRRRFARDEDTDEAPAPEPALPSMADEAGPVSEPGPAPEPLPQLPAEPAPDRSRIGRELAAAAAEMEAGLAPDPGLRRRPSGRPEFHLTPVLDRGRRRFEPEEMKALPLADDPFAAAESEAVIEAVVEMDEVDEVDFQEPANQESSEADARPPAATDDTDAGESVALRLAILGYEAEPEVGDPSTTSTDEPDDLLDLRMSLLGGEAELEDSEPGVAGTDAGAGESLEPGGETEAEQDDLIALRMVFLAGEAQLEADGIQAAEEPVAEAEVEDTAGVAVEPEAEAEAPVELQPPDEPEAEVAVEPAVEAVVEPELEVAEQVESSAEVQATGDGPDWELSEREAEAAALREAVAMLLEAETADAGTESATEPPADATETKPAEAGEPASQEPGPEPHRRGFLRRIIGG